MLAFTETRLRPEAQPFSGSAREEARSAADGTPSKHQLDEITRYNQEEHRNDGNDHAPWMNEVRTPGQSSACRLWCVLPPLDLNGLVSEVTPWARAFARVLPTATLVPALAIRGAPAPLRGAIALALAAPIAASFAVVPPASLAITLVADAISGIPLAIAIATPLWMATHVGAIADLMRGTPEANIAPPPAAEGARGPLGTLAALLAASAWVASGGVVRALLLLQRSERSGIAAYALAARALADGLRLSLALSAGVLIGAVALEAAVIAIGRAASPISIQPIAMLARPVVAVISLALSIEVAVRILVS